MRTSFCFDQICTDWPIQRNREGNPAISDFGRMGEEAAGPPWSGSYFVTQQAATCPGSPCFCSSGGISSTHFLRTRTCSPPVVIWTTSDPAACAAAVLVSGQRGWKGHPVGGLLGL